MSIDVLTPPSILRVLQKSYGPRWHPSALPILPARP
jgi:hypothetical protein